MLFIKYVYISGSNLKFCKQHLNMGGSKFDIINIFFKKKKKGNTIDFC